MFCKALAIDSRYFSHEQTNNSYFMLTAFNSVLVPSPAINCSGKCISQTKKGLKT